MGFLGDIGNTLWSMATFPIDVFSGKEANRSNEKMRSQEIANQKEFAQKGIRWRVADAKAAGLHPLAALGANTTSYTPQAVGSTNDPYGTMGQNITRAISQKMTNLEKTLQLINIRKAELELENMGLQNASLRKQVEDLDSPPMPNTVNNQFGIIDGQNPTSPKLGHQFTTNQISSSSRMGTTSGKGPLETEVIDNFGNVWRFPSQDIADAMESSPYNAIKYGIFQGVEHLKGIYDPFYKGHKPKNPPKGFKYVYNKITGMWKLVPNVTNSPSWKSKKRRKYNALQTKKQKARFKAIFQDEF